MAVWDELIGGLSHPSHGRALRRLGDRVGELFEERLVEIVPGKRLDRLRNQIRRQLIESYTNDTHTRTDMDQRNLGALSDSGYSTRWVRE
jgi:hypothetical protein